MSSLVITVGWCAFLLLVLFLVLWALMELVSWHNRRVLADLRALRPRQIDVWREEDGDAA